MLQCTTRWTSQGFLCQLFVVIVAQAVGANRPLIWRETEGDLVVIKTSI